MLQTRKYALLSDKELIDGLTAVPANNKLHEYFFNEKCKHFLTYISTTLYNENDCNTLVGEFYEYLSDNNWKVLKMWKGKNNSSLYSYLASCSMHYFTSKANAEKKRGEYEVTPTTPEIIEYLNHFTAEEENDNQPVWEAYRMLKERDQVILRQLVIEENDMILAAPIIWPHINTTREMHELSQKQIQNTISMAKHRALAFLLNNLKSLTKN